MASQETAQCWLVDETGRSWRTNDPGLRLSLRTDISTEQLRKFAVGKMGFVEIRRRGRQIVVTLDPRKVTQPAIAGLLYWLLDANWVGRLALQIFGADRDAELIPNLAALGARLEALVQGGGAPELARFKSTPVAITELASDASIQALFDLWRTSTVRPRTDVAAHCEQHFNGRYTLVRPQSNGEFLVAEMGRGYHCYDRSYVSTAPGTLLIDEPDHAYGMWVSEAYRSVVLSRAPDFSDIAATLKARNESTVRVQYRRLVIPFTDPHFGEFLVSASILRQAS